MSKRFNFPEKIILVSTTHGIIKGRHTDLGFEPDLFKLPEGIRLFKLNVSSLGECNYMTDDTVKQYTKKVKSYAPYILRTKSSDLNLQKKKLLEIASVIKTEESKEELKERRNELNNILKKVKKGEKLSQSEEESSADLLSYLMAYDRSYNLNIFNPGDEIINKNYSRENIETTKYDWVMKIINMKGQPDLMQLYNTQTRRGTSRINLDEIINFLKENGVRQIYMFDFSCAVFLDEEVSDYLKSRSKRSARLSISKRGIHGGRKKTIKRKTKHNRTKKNQKKFKRYN